MQRVCKPKATSTTILPPTKTGGGGNRDDKGKFFLAQCPVYMCTKTNQTVMSAQAVAIHTDPIYALQASQTIALFRLSLKQNEYVSSLKDCSIKFLDVEIHYDTIDTNGYWMRVLPHQDEEPIDIEKIEEYSEIHGILSHIYPYRVWSS
jgi:hypothetical protein